ncbi:hypothetical protein ABK040_010984 [Willaertia magna]
MGVSGSKTIAEELQMPTPEHVGNQDYYTILKKINNSKVLCQKIPDIKKRELMALQLSNIEQFKHNYLNFQSVLSNVSILDTDIKMKIKFVLVDNMKSETSKNVRQIISPLLDKIDQLPHHGIYHSCLTIGPWMIDYTDCGLCIPRPIISKSAFLSIDLLEISGVANVTNVIDKLANSIHRWNTKVNYKRKSGRKRDSNLFQRLDLSSYEVGESTTSTQPQVTQQQEINKEQLFIEEEAGNCQDFVDYILDCLQIKPMFSECLQNFLHQSKVKGRPELTLKLNETFCKRFQFLNNSILPLKTIFSALNIDPTTDITKLMKSLALCLHKRPNSLKEDNNNNGDDKKLNTRKSAGDIDPLRHNNNDLMMMTSSSTIKTTLSLNQYLSNTNNNNNDSYNDYENDESNIKLENYCITFTNHFQIDLFAHICIFQDNNFNENYKEIYELLKAFDRAKWLKHQSLLSLKTVATLEDRQTFRNTEALHWSTWNSNSMCHETYSCPFGDPFLKTRSFMSLK